MLNLDSLKYDKNKAENGVWVDYRNGSRLKIARQGNTRVDVFRRRLNRFQLRDLDSGRDRENQRKVMTEMAAYCLLLDWEKVAGPDGQPIEYTAEIGKETLAKYDTMLADVLELANDVAIFAEDDKGNSSGDSAGT